MTKRPDAAYWLHKLQLIRHVEGGAFREIYRSGLVVPRQSQRWSGSTRRMRG